QGAVRGDFQHDVGLVERDLSQLQPAAEQRYQPGPQDEPFDGQPLREGAASSAQQTDLVQLDPVPAHRSLADGQLFADYASQLLLYEGGEVPVSPPGGPEYDQSQDTKTQGDDFLHFSGQHIFQIREIVDCETAAVRHMNGGSWLFSSRFCRRLGATTESLSMVQTHIKI